MASLIFHPWPIALAFGVGFLFWGLPGWSYLLCRIAGIEPPRSASALEAACNVAPGVIAPFFLRMLFVLPGVAAVAWLLGLPRRSSLQLRRLHAALPATRNAGLASR